MLKLGRYPPPKNQSSHFKSAAHKHHLFHLQIELEPAIIPKVATCQRITSKNTRTPTMGRYLSPRYWSAQTLF